MTAVSSSTSLSVTWNTLYNLLNDNITDPVSRSKKWIFSAFPDIEGANFPGYPIIIVEPIKSTIPESNFGMENSERSFNTSVWIYDNNIKRVEDTADSVIDTLDSNRSTFLGSGLNTLNIDTGASDTELQGNRRIHFKELTMGLKARL